MVRISVSSMPPLENPLTPAIAFFAVVVLTALCCDELLLAQSAEPPSPPPAPFAVENARQVPSTSKPIFQPDFGVNARLGWWKKIQPIDELTRLDPSSQGIDASKVGIDIVSVSGPVLKLPSGRIGIAANPGKHFRISLTARYKTPEFTKLFSNLKLDAILPPTATQELMAFHADTWHFDTESRAGYSSVLGEGEITFNLVGLAPDSKGAFDFDIDVGLMPMATGGLLKKLYAATVLTEFKTPDEIKYQAVAMDPAGLFVAVGDMQGTIQILSAANGEKQAEWSLCSAPINVLAISPNGKILAVGVDRSHDSKAELAEILLCSLPDGRVLGTLSGHAQRVNSLCFTGTDDRLASAGNDGRVALWDLANAKLSQQYQYPEAIAVGLSYDANSSRIAVVMSNQVQQHRVRMETATRTVSVTKCRTETRQRSFVVQVPVTTEVERQRMVDVAGRLESWMSKVFQTTYNTEQRTQDYTISVPYTESVEQAYTVLVPYAEQVKTSESPYLPRVIQLSATDARLLNSWMPEGKRVPVGTSYATDGKRLFVTTENGISVLEPKSMLELVELRGSTYERHSVSAAFSNGLTQLIQPTFSSGIGKPAALTFLRPKSHKSVSIFDTLAASAKKHNQQTLDASQRASEAAQTLIAASKLSAGASPAPVSNISTAPTTPAAEVQKKLVELKPNVEQVDLTECEFEARTIGDPPESEKVAGKLGDFKVGDEVFPNGLWAHAPSHYAFKLPPGWSTFTTMFGLEEGRNGSVAFVILGDGKPLYRSSIIRDHILHGITVDVRGVKLLELITEQSDQSNKEDWGLWLEPRLLRKPSPDAYPHNFAELKVKVEKLDGCDIQISSKGLEVIGLKNSDPTITVNGAVWKPKSQKLFPNEGSNQYLDDDLDYARAYVHLHEVTGGGNLSYAYAADHVRIEMTSVTNGSSDFELVIQIPKRVGDLTTVDTVPLWGGPWKVAVWEYAASWWGELPTEVPPKATKPSAVAEFDFVDWNEVNRVFPSPQTPSDHFVLIGERKFKSDGGLYSIETIADDGIRVNLDGKSVIERWKMQGVAQDVKLLEIPAGIHTLRFEYVDAVGRARVGVMLRCMEPKGTELERKIVELSVAQKSTQKPIRDSIAKLRALGAYVHEELNSPTPLVTEVNLQVATGKVDKRAIAALRNLPDVRALAFGTNEIEPKAWSQLASLKTLRELALIYGAFDTEALTEIAKLQSLETLGILGSGIDDEKLKLIAKLPKLKSLSLWYMKATDGCIDTVASMTALRHFDFGGTEITEAGVEKLMLARPDLQLSHGLKLRPGTVVFEISPLDEKAVFTIDGKTYRRDELEQPIEIATGKHVIAVTLGGKQLLSESFTVIPNQRKKVELIDQ